MTVTAYGGPPPPRPIPPTPPITQQWAVQMGFTKAEYKQAVGCFQSLGSIQPHAVPGRIESLARRPLLQRAAHTAKEELAGESERLLAPCLDESEQAIGVVSARVEELEAWPDREFRCEGRLCTVAEGREITDTLTVTIEEDTNSQHFHHRRIAGWWKILAIHLLFADLAAFMVILANMFNVDYTHPLATPLQTLTVYVVPLLFVVVQWFAADRTGERLNEYREKSMFPLEEPGPLLRSARLWAAFTAFIAIGYTSLLIWRLLAMARDADLGIVLQVIFTVLGIAIGLGTPLTKVYVVAEDGSSVSRRRDLFAAALDKQRVQWAAAVQEAREALGAAAARHEEYTGQLRPQVLRRAGEPLVEAENALGLLNLMLGAGGSAAPRVLPVTTGELPPLRWRLENAPEIDNEQLSLRDDTYRRQRARVRELREQLGRHHTMRAAPRPESPGNAIEMYG
jgi:hypothetical protein